MGRKDGILQSLPEIYVLYEKINMGKTLRSMSIREVELVKHNVKMLDWAMAIVSGKKKIAAPKITISDYIPYVIQPPYEHAFVGPLVSREPTEPQSEQKKDQNI